MTFNVSYIANDKINIGIGKKAFYATSVELPVAGTTTMKTLYETTESAVIDEIDWIPGSSTLTTIAINIFGAGPDFLANNGKSAFPNITPESILGGKALNYFDVVQYDTLTNTYRFQLKKPIYCPEGFRINLNTESSISQGVVNSCQVRGRSV